MIKKNTSYIDKLMEFLNKLFHTPGTRDPDYTFMILLGLILLLGLLFLSSASSVISYDKFGDAYYYLKSQIFKGVIFGSIFFFIFSKIHYVKLKKYVLPFLILSIIFVGLVFIPGVGVELLGGRRWISLFGFTFQPTELLKLAMVIYLAAWFDSRQQVIKDFKQVYLPFVGVLALIGLIVMLQPDLGTTVLSIAIAMTMYFLAGGHLGLIIGSGMLSAALVWWLIKIAPYRADRLNIFLHPELDPQGIGYHINQAFLTIGSGGLFGRGIVRSRQKFNYLPEVAGDSIFAVMAEELGFIFTVFFILLMFAFFYRGLKIADQAPDMFAKLVTFGIMAWVIWQSLLNIMAMLGLVPLTGVTLPFVSYGSSSLVFLLMAMGIVVNISKYSKCPLPRIQEIIMKVRRSLLLTVLKPFTTLSNTN